MSPDQVQAAYLFNFTQFIAWPQSAFPDATAPFVIGVIGREAFVKLLREVVKGEKNNGREIVVRSFDRIQDIDTCHVLFIDRSQETDFAKILPLLGERHVLTVSNMSGFADRGGMIEFFEENARIRFRVNVHRAKSASLEISSKLLRPAVIVEPEVHNRTSWSEAFASHDDRPASLPPIRASAARPRLFFDESLSSGWVLSPWRAALREKRCGYKADTFS